VTGKADGNDKQVGDNNSGGLVAKATSMNVGLQQNYNTRWKKKKGLCVDFMENGTVRLSCFVI
jgi:hypothetical protein